MARRMGSSRSALDRLLDPSNDSVTPATLSKAAAAVGLRLSGHCTRQCERGAARELTRIRLSGARVCTAAIARPS